MSALKDFIATQADPAHCKSASFAAAGPRSDHTGIRPNFSNVKSGGSSTAPKLSTLGDRKQQTAILGNY